jgi:glycerophosphoryl diester phosphodiesterase
MPDLLTLEEAIEIVNRRRPLLLEVKPRVPTDPIVAVLHNYLKKGWTAKDFLVCSSRFYVLVALQHDIPEIPRVVIERWSGVRGTWRARRLETKRLSMQRKWLWSGFIRSMAGRGWQLYAYTVNDPAVARRYESYGMTGIITDYPDLFEKK